MARNFSGGRFRGPTTTDPFALAQSRASGSASVISFAPKYKYTAIELTSGANQEVQSPTFRLRGRERQAKAWILNCLSDMLTGLNLNTTLQPDLLSSDPFRRRRRSP